MQAEVAEALPAFVYNALQDADRATRVVLTSTGVAVGEAFRALPDRRAIYLMVLGSTPVRVPRAWNR